MVVVEEMEGGRKEKSEFSKPWLCARNTKSKTGKQQSARKIAQVILLQNQLWFLDRERLCHLAALVAPECRWSPCFSLLSSWDYSPVPLCWAKTSSLTIALKKEETLNIPQDNTLHLLMGNSKWFSPSFLFWPTHPQMLSSGYLMGQLLWNSSFRWSATNGSPVSENMEYANHRHDTYLNNENNWFSTSLPRYLKLSSLGLLPLCPYLLQMWDVDSVFPLMTHVGVIRYYKNSFWFPMEGLMSLQYGHSLIWSLLKQKIFKSSILSIQSKGDQYDTCWVLIVGNTQNVFSN